MKTIKFLLAVLFLAMTAGAAFAQETSAVGAQGSAGQLEEVKEKILSKVQALKAQRGPFTGKLVSCDGSNDVDGVSINPANFPNLTISMLVFVPKMTTKTRLQIKSTIQCSTDSDGRIGSIIAIVDVAQNVFCADPDPNCRFFFVCNANESFRQHTGVWWFNPLNEPTFVPGNVFVARVDTDAPGENAIGFRSLCVDKMS